MRLCKKQYLEIAYSKRFVFYCLVVQKKLCFGLIVKMNFLYQMFSILLITSGMRFLFA